MTHARAAAAAAEAGIPRKPCWSAAVLAAAALLLAACQPQQDAAEPPTVLAARLPAEAAGFARGEAAPLPQADGVEVAYATRGSFAAGAAVAVSRPASAAPGDPATALDAMLDEATQPAPQRQVLRRGDAFVVPAAGGGAPVFRCAATDGRYGRERVEGLACAGVAAGNEVRLRVTAPQRGSAGTDARAFAEAIAASLGAPPRRAR